MFNLWTRVQAAGNQALTASTVVAGIVVLLTLVQLWRDQVWLLDSTTIANVRLATTVKRLFQYGSQNKKPKENNKISFDLSTDLTPLFNWNTKQVFIYLTATYEGADGELTVTYWDKIIRTRDDAKLALNGAKAKYSVWDIEELFRERPATLQLEWNIQPWIGPLIDGKTGEVATFEFSSPKDKAEKEREKQAQRQEKKRQRAKREE